MDDWKGRGVPGIDGFNDFPAPGTGMSHKSSKIQTSLLEMCLFRDKNDGFLLFPRRNGFLRNSWVEHVLGVDFPALEIIRGF